MIFLSEYQNTLKIGILTIIFLKKCVTRQKKRIFVCRFSHYESVREFAGFSEAGIRCHASSGVCDTVHWYAAQCCEVALLTVAVLIPAVIAVRLKVFDVICFAFLVTIAINAMFESVFEMQMGIIFFCFFWQVLFQKNMGEQDTLSPQVIQDIKF